VFNDNYSCTSTTIIIACARATKNAAPKGLKALSDPRVLPYKLLRDRGPSNTRTAKRRRP
jgi:hypothetical protein